MIRVIKKLLPSGRAFRAEEGSVFREILLALIREPERMIDTFEEIRDSGLPGRIPAQHLPEWEELYDLLYDPDLTDDERQDRILAMVAAQGGLGVDTLQEIIDAYGFGVTLYDNPPIDTIIQGYPVITGSPEYNSDGTIIEYDMNEPVLWGQSYTGNFKRLRKMPYVNFLACGYQNDEVIAGTTGRLKYSGDAGVTWRDISLNTAANFNGVNSFIAVGDYVANPTGHTFSFWFRKAAAPPAANQWILDRYADANNNYNIFVRQPAPAGRLTFYNRIGGVSSNSANSVANVCDGAWHFVFLRFIDATTVQWIIDGTPEAPITINVALQAIAFTSVNLGRRGDVALYLDADLDDFRIYDRLLSNDELAVLYSGRNIAGAYIHYTFDNTADFGEDASGNGRDGVAANVTKSLYSSPVLDGDISNAEWKCGKGYTLGGVFRGVFAQMNGRVYRGTNIDRLIETRPAGDVDVEWNCMDADPGIQYIILGSLNGRVWVSDDSGVTWTEVRPLGNTDQDYLDVATADSGNRLVVSCNSRLYYSGDGGANWDEARPLGDNDHTWNVVTMSFDGNRVYVAGLFTGVWYSDDFCATWVEVYDGAYPLNWVEGETSADGAGLLLVSEDPTMGVNENFAMHFSPNAYEEQYGANWQRFNTGRRYPIRDSDFWTVTLDKYTVNSLGETVSPKWYCARRIFTAFGFIGEVWIDGDHGFAGNFFKAEYAKHNWVVAGLARALRADFLAQNWEDLGAIGIAVFSVGYGDGVTIFSDLAGTVHRSTNRGDTYETIVMPEANSWYDIKYSNGTWIAVAASGALRVARSVDGGLTWAGIAVPVGGWRRIATNGDGVWVAVGIGVGEKIMRSTDDGLTWVAVTPFVDLDHYDIDYRNGIFAAVINTGVHNVVYSEDLGATWHGVLIDGVNWVTIASSSDGVWVIGNVTTGNIMRSVDGCRTWELVTPPIALAISEIGSMDIGEFETFLAVSGNIVSEYLWSPSEIYSKDPNLFRFEREFRHLVVIAGATINTEVNLPATREREFKRLMYRLKPVDAWLVEKVNYI